MVEVVKNASDELSWITASTEQEVKDESVFLKLLISRKRKEFGASYKFGDSDAHEGLVECRPFKNPNYDLAKLEKNIGIQSVPFLKESSVQTSCGTQCELFDEEMTKNVANVTSPQEVQEFLKKALPGLEYALQQNETVNIFSDEFEKLSEEDVMIGNKVENSMKEFQSFTDFEFSNDRSISALDWKPQANGVVAVACAEKNTLDTTSINPTHAPSSNPQTGNTTSPLPTISSVNVSTSVILIWDFIDPIHPQFILEAPADVLCFKFDPKRPHQIVGGCENGQVVYWDLNTNQKRTITFTQKKSERKENSSNVNTNTNTAPSVANPTTALASNGDEDQKRTVTLIPFLVSSSIELGHKKPVTSLMWLANEKINKDGSVSKSQNEYSQVITTSIDGQILVWDIEELSKTRNLQDLDLSWAPFFRLKWISKSQYPYSCTNAMIKSTDSSFKLFGCTLDGQVICVDWEDLVKSNTEEQSLIKEMAIKHYGTCVCISPSSVFSDVLFSAGDWTVNIWKDGLSMKPLFSSPCSSSYVTVVKSSPTRPSVFFVGKADGGIDIWDLLDKSHLPALSQVVCSSAITSMDFFSSKNNSDGTIVQLLAVGDNQGRLHILEIPKNFTYKVLKEKVLAENFFGREEKRIEYELSNSKIDNELSLIVK